MPTNLESLSVDSDTSTSITTTIAITYNERNESILKGQVKSLKTNNN